MAPENSTSDPRELRWLPSLPQQRGGRAWESLRAVVRRRTMRLVGGEAPTASALDLRLTARLSLEVDGSRALFFRNEELRMEAPSDLPAPAVAFTSFLMRIAGAPALSAKRGIVRASILDRLESLVLEETEVVGELRSGMGVGPEGLWMELADLEREPLCEADGAALVLSFDGGPSLHEPLRDGAALFRAGAALMETRGLVGAHVEFGQFGRVEFEPSSR